MGSKKMGRPKTDNPLKNDLKVRFTDEMLGRLDDYCKKHDNVSKAEVIRNAVVEFLEKHK